MKILTTGQIRKADLYTIEQEPIKSIDLMERAAKACTRWLASRLSKEKYLIVFVGPGNNGGDGWAIARQMSDLGYRVSLFLLRISNTISPDSEINRQRLEQQGRVDSNEIVNKSHFPKLGENTVVIDSLFGSGLTRELEGVAAELVHYINSQNVIRISIDVPSGMFADRHNGNSPIIKADHTLSFQFPKLGFMLSENHVYTGQWYILPIGLHSEYIKEVRTNYFFIEIKDIAKQLLIRDKFSHKGCFGHALLICGSYGMMGAAVLTTRACLKTGAGLVSVHVPSRGYEIMQVSVPEALVSIDPNEKYFSELPVLDDYDALGIGPGLGRQGVTTKALEMLLSSCKRPILIDADAINILSENKEWMGMLPENSILTPHPKEFERLFGKSSNDFERLALLRSEACKYRVIIVLKGAYTAIAFPSGEISFNSTGNPGMATGGSGDVLTGIILSLLAQKYTPEQAARIGVFVHGLAADIAIDEQESVESLIAGDLIGYLGRVFKRIKKSII